MATTALRKPAPRAPLVLIVDDEPDVRDMMRDLFEGEGYLVETAEDGQDALDKLETIGRPSVILLDLMMPRMSGNAFLEAARKKRPEMARVPVVVITGYAQMMMAAQSVTRILQKPVDLSALLAIVRGYCEPRGTGASLHR